MVRSFSLAALAFCTGLLPAAPAAAQPAKDLTIEPGRRAGLIVEGMTEARLKALLPKGAVKRRLRPIGEGYTECGTGIFPGTANSAFVTWHTITETFEGDTPKHRRTCLSQPAPSKPRSITLEKGLDKPWPASAWRITGGIRLGMNLRELEAALGEPFDVSVCACDFGGVVLAERLKTDRLAGVSLWFDFPGEAERILGKAVRANEDYAVRSSDVPDALAKRFRVYRIDVSLGE